MKKSIVFIVGLIISLMVLGVLPSRASTTIGISYDQVMKGFEFMEVTRGHDTPNQLPSYVGMAPDGLTMIQIIGSKKNISRTAIIVAFPNDDLDVFHRSISLLIKFLGNVFPKWDCMEWLGYAIHTATNKGEPIGFISGSISVKFSPIGRGLFCLGIKHKNAK